MIEKEGNTPLPNKPVIWEKASDKWTRITLGRDIVLIRRPSVTAFEDKFQLDEMVMIIWSKGEVKGKINYSEYIVDSPCLVLIRPHQLISVESISHDFKAYFVMMSPSFLDKLQISMADFAPPLFFRILRENSVVKLPGHNIEVVKSYFNLLYRVLMDEDNVMKEACAINLTRSFLYEAAYYLQREQSEPWLSKNNPLISRLIHLIRSNFRSHRDTSFYAAQLRLTPNHLYKICKDATGKSVAEWIEDYTVTEAKMLLRNSDLSIKEISDKLNFPSQSYFGKYFKRVTGISPKEYQKG